MKKNIFSAVVLFLILVAGSNALLPHSANAADPTATVTVTTTPTGSTGAVEIDGVLNQEAYNLSSARGLLGMRYGRWIDLNDKLVEKDLTTVIGCSLTKTQAPCIYDTKTFVIKLTDLKPGRYSYQIGYFTSNVSSVQFTPFSHTISFFDISGVADDPSVRFNHVNLSGKDADVYLDALNVPVATSGYIQLGIASRQGVTSNYTCTAGGPTSPVISVPATGAGAATIHNLFSNLPDNVYCVRPLIKLQNGVLQPVASGSGANGDGYFTDSSALIAIGVILPPGATINPSANKLGCVQGDGNKGYCLLAPLPGIGDKDTGYLDVTTGMGDYILKVIRLVMGIIGVLAVLMIIVGGIEYMSTVSIGEKEGAKSRITNALFGLLLALASYLVLNTINPNLVNINIGVPSATVSITGEEGAEVDETDLVLPSDNKVPTGITVPTGSAQDLANQILQNSKITLLGQWGSQDAKSSVMQNIKDTAAGKSAWTSPSKQGGQTQAALNSRMLAGILAAANAAGNITVSEILGGKHTTNSAHYRGLAFDISGSPFSYSTTVTKKIEDACRAAGANPKQIFGPCGGVGKGHSEFIFCSATGYRTNNEHENHVHCGW